MFQRDLSVISKLAKTAIGKDMKKVLQALNDVCKSDPLSRSAFIYNYCGAKVSSPKMPFMAEFAE